MWTPALAGRPGKLRGILSCVGRPSEGPTSRNQPESSACPQGSPSHYAIAVLALAFSGNET
eukprot:1158478-Pelagomonas_calceolata.AAC.2